MSEPTEDIGGLDEAALILCLGGYDGHQLGQLGYQAVVAQGCWEGLLP